jgi:SAM-dependent methyltransferase
MRPSIHSSLDAPSAWVARFAAFIPKGDVLDVACGHGRHARLLQSMGFNVLAIDRDPAALAEVAASGIATLRIDLENGPDGGSVWPFGACRFSGIVVTNYLHRPLLQRLTTSLAPGGLLIYETFATGNELYGKPSNPDFLLEPGELLQAVNDASPQPLQVIAYEAGCIRQPKLAAVQRICAVRMEKPGKPTLLPLD